MQLTPSEVRGIEQALDFVCAHRKRGPSPSADPFAAKTAEVLRQCTTAAAAQEPVCLNQAPALFCSAQPRDVQTFCNTFGTSARVVCGTAGATGRATGCYSGSAYLGRGTA